MPVTSPGASKAIKSPDLWKLVREKMNLQFYSHQIAGELKKRFPQDWPMQISNEAIYKYLYVHALGKLKKQLIRELIKPKRNADNTG